MRRTSDVIRILYLAGDKYPPFRVDIRVLFGEELTQRGIEVDWVLQSEQPCEQAYETTLHGGRAWIGPTDAGHGRFARLRKHMLGIRHDFGRLREARRAGYDFVLVRNKVIAAAMALLTCGGTSARPVYWMSFPYAEASIYEARTGTARYPLFYLVRGWVFALLLYRVLLPRMYHVFVQSEQMKRDVMAQGLREAQLTPVPMGVQLRDIPFDENYERASDNEVRILYLGTLNRLRQVDFVVRVFAEVKQRFPTAVLELIGKGDSPRDMEVLEEEARRCGVLDSVRFVGFLPMTEAWEYVRRADVCVSPFYPTPILNSTSPTKLIEYLAMARPVVANDHPDQRHVLAASGGGICVGWNETEFAEAIGRILDDPAAAAEMGQRGRRYVEEHRAYSVIADQVAATFASLNAQRA